MSDDTISDESEPVVDETDGGGGMTGDADGAGYSAVGDAGPQVCEMITIEGAEGPVEQVNRFWQNFRVCMGPLPTPAELFTSPEQLIGVWLKLKRVMLLLRSEATLVELAAAASLPALEFGGAEILASAYVGALTGCLIGAGLTPSTWGF